MAVSTSKRDESVSDRHLKDKGQGSRITLRKSPRVALLIETSKSFGRHLLRGINQYNRATTPWTIYFAERSVWDDVPRWLTKWSGDGIISRISTPEVARSLLQSSIPIVDLNEQLRGMGIPLISNDHAAVGRMAAEHLLQRRFEVYGYLGHGGFQWSDRRGAAFAAVVEQAGFPCHIYPCKYRSHRQVVQRPWDLELDNIAAWVAGLPKPVGIMASDDFRGLQLLNACVMAGVSVPEQAAVLAVGDDDVACELSNPPLSSVVLNARRMGYEAAALLDRMMHGEKPDVDELLIPPLEIVTRQSTDVTAIADPIVAKAMQFIRQHACDGIKIKDVLRYTLVSRTALQGRFRHAIGRSIHDVILSYRVERVKEMLAYTDLSLADIAERTGFRYAEYMSTVFKKCAGFTPANYRRECGRRAGKRAQGDL
jgi:LacI family transcriptional regulator